jgi:hypothetical protein
MTTSGEARFALLGAKAVALCGLLIACTVKSKAPPDPPSMQASPYDVPCDEKQILQKICQQCHSAPPQNGAPFPLVTYENTQANFKGQPISDQMLYVLQNGKMPLPPVTIEPADKDTLIRWLMAGSPSRPAGGICPPAVVTAEAGIDPDDAAADAANTDGDADRDCEAGVSPVDASDPEAPTGDFEDSAAIEASDAGRDIDTSSGEGGAMYGD